MAHALVTGVLRDGRSLGASRRGPLDSRLDPRDKALAQELAFGTLRHLQRLDAWLEHVAARPPRDVDVRTLVLIGLYQLEFTRIPPHAAVSTTVDLARSLGKPWAAGFVNAALRRFAAERDAILDIDLAATARLAHPAWLLAALERSWPAQWESIARASLERPPMTLRVNTRRTSRRRYLDNLSNDGVAARPTRHSAQGVALESPRDVESVPGFGEGLVSVQDEAAQLAAPLLDAPRGSRVLDACAAPGGKTAHIVERGAGTVEVVALDDDPRRITDLGRTLARLGLSAHARLGDAANPHTWWDGRQFDRILLDAPCSGTGVIRRHPDIKVLRRPSDIETMARRQSAMLHALWPLLVRGGRLLYATCCPVRTNRSSKIFWRIRLVRRRSESNPRGAGRPDTVARYCPAMTRWTGSSMLRWKSVDLGARAATLLPWLAPGLAALSLASLSFAHSVHAAPASPGFAVEHAELRTVGEFYVADARIECKFSADSLEAMRNGVPLTVIVEIEVRRKRGQWWDETLAASELGYRMESNVLTGMYRMRNLHDGQTRNFRSLDEMVEALGYLESIPVIARNRLSGDERYTARIRARLDIEALPSPLRPIAYLSPDWRLNSGWFEWRIPR